ncbi:mycofactocin-coupled SDR family oxidoreductase [Amycolatopsis ultiminotia]|uniref:Mycofactocin-coupled SDR family oxidoreductase n=1 Tax=Amycolatopsis ultiminotia TaxID=543629 RepID=A0ABP6V318_9PSEU
MGRVQDKVVFITGAARGQGRAHAIRLAEEGADIIAVDICTDIATNAYPLAGPEDLEETVREVEKLDRRIVARTADVRDPAALKAAVADGVSELGRLDAVVAQAGICPLGTQDAQAFLDAVTVDFNGVVNAVDAALPHLADGGSVVATGSLAALVAGSTDNPNNGFGGLGYSLAKRSVAAFVNDLALVLAPRKSRANAVHPTNCDTDMLNSDLMYRQFRPDLDNPTRADALPAFPVMSAMGVPYVQPRDVADAVLFLVSDESRYVTGMQLRVDAGGYVRRRPQQPPF